uniref:Uncharacterized protein n=1 Tax=Triticum urartu TaxID=4572 RepID=A0A8R7Q2K5_TRIUA
PLPRSAQCSLGHSAFPRADTTPPPRPPLPLVAPSLSSSAATTPFPNPLVLLPRACPRPHRQAELAPIHLEHILFDEMPSSQSSLFSPVAPAAAHMIHACVSFQ